MVKLSYRSYALQFKHPFGVSGHTRNETLSVFLKLEQDSLQAYGEACLPAYLGETVEGTIAFFERARPLLEATTTAERGVEEIMRELDQLDTGCNAAKAAIDIALNDLAAKKAVLAFRNWKGVATRHGVETSYTIGIASEEMIVQKIKEAEPYAILKIKAGTEDDRELITLVRKYTSKPLFIDVNQGWKNKEEAARTIDWLQHKNVLLLEQPMPKTMNDDMWWLNERSPIPIIADESIKRLSDLEELGKAFSGINIKLMKCTGLTEALKMIAFCRKNGLKIMLGCMAESSCATSAMAQLMADADFVDLDAPLLSKNDPFEGVTYKNGKIYLNDWPGIGVRPKPGMVDM